MFSATAPGSYPAMATEGDRSGCGGEPDVGVRSKAWQEQSRHETLRARHASRRLSGDADLAAAASQVEADLATASQDRRRGDQW
jgi:hypothetical protein